MVILPREIWTFNVFPVKISMKIFTEQEKIILKFKQNHKRQEVVEKILIKKNRPEGINLPNFRLYYKVIVIKTAWY